MGELSGQALHPVAPADHNQGAGTGSGRPSPDGAAAGPGDRPPVAQQPPDKPAADQRGSDGTGRADTPQTPPGQPGPVTEHPDVRQYMQLGKQTPETPAPTPMPTDSGPPDAHPLQASPGAAPDGHTPSGVTPDGHSAGSGQHPESKPDAAAVRPMPAHAADTHGSATVPAAGQAQDQGSASGARDQKAGAPEAPEKPLDRDVRLHLQSFGVTPEQAHDYMHIVLTPTLHPDATAKGMAPADLQRVGDAVSHLPAPLLDHVVEQAKGINANPGAASQTLDTGRVVDGARQFGFGHSLLTPGVTDSAGPPKIPFHSPQPTVVPPPAHQPQFFQPPAPKPGDQPSEAAAKFIDHAATGAPEHRAPEGSNGDKLSQGDLGKLLGLAYGHSGISKLTSIIEANASHLPAQLAHHPAAFAAAVHAAVTIVTAGVGLDARTERPTAPGSTPAASDTSPTGKVGELLDSHLAHWGGMQSVNLVLSLLPGPVTFGVQFERNTLTSPDNAKAHGPVTIEETKGGISAKFKF